MKKDDIYIAILKYGKVNLEEGITKNGLLVYLRAKGYDTTERGFNVCVASMMFCNHFARVGGKMSDWNSVDEHYLRMDAYFKFLEYEELNEARISSKRALGRSTSAIVISAILAVFSIIVSIWQLNSPMRLHDDQLRRLIVSEKSVREALDKSGVAVSLQKINENVAGIESYDYSVQIDLMSQQIKEIDEKFLLIVKESEKEEVSNN